MKGLDKYLTTKPFDAVRSKPRKRPSHPESDLQKACVKWFKYQYPQRVIFAIPNGGNRSRIEAAIMQGEGVLSGVSDLFIPEPIFKTEGSISTVAHGMFIEMKAGKGKTTPNQCEFLLDMQKRGYRCEVCNSLDEFMKIVTDYFLIFKGHAKP